MVLRRAPKTRNHDAQSRNPCCGHTLPGVFLRVTLALVDAPPGATIDPTNGWFSWKQPLTEPAGVRRIAVRVRDDGLPPLDHIDRLSVTIVRLLVALSSTRRHFPIA